MCAGVEVPAARPPRADIRPSTPPPALRYPPPMQVNIKHPIRPMNRGVVIAIFFAIDSHAWTAPSQAWSRKRNRLPPTPAAAVVWGVRRPQSTIRRSCESRNLAIRPPRRKSTAIQPPPCHALPRLKPRAAPHPTAKQPRFNLKPPLRRSCESRACPRESGGTSLSDPARSW